MFKNSKPHLADSSKLIFDAIDSDNVQLIQSIKRGNRLLSSRDEHCRTPLIWAAIWGHSHILNHLIRSGANINAVDEYGRNALYYCFANINHGNEPLINVLIANAIDINLECLDEFKQFYPEYFINANIADALYYKNFEAVHAFVRNHQYQKPNKRLNIIFERVYNLCIIKSIPNGFSDFLNMLSYCSLEHEKDKKTTCDVIDISDYIKESWPRQTQARLL